MRKNKLGSARRSADRFTRATRPSARPSITTTTTHSRALDRLRCAYFAQAGETASRYGISFERVIRHLWQARRSNRRFTLQNIAHVDDLLHAIACADDVALAWTDLAERYERTLVRKCRANFDEMEATVFVRRVLADLRHRSVLEHDERLPSLHTYLGTRPLRLWLADRMIGAKSWAGLLESCVRRPRSRPLRLAGTAAAGSWFSGDHWSAASGQ